MPPPQAVADTGTVDQLRAGRTGDVLAALQRLRAVSLHPQPDAEFDDGAFIRASAPRISAFLTLEQIAAKAERALLFVENLSVRRGRREFKRKARLTGLI